MALEAVIPPCLDGQGERSLPWVSLGAWTELHPNSPPPVAKAKLQQESAVGKTKLLCELGLQEKAQVGSNSTHQRKYCPQFTQHLTLKATDKTNEQWVYFTTVGNKPRADATFGKRMAPMHQEEQQGGCSE